MQTRPTLRLGFPRAAAKILSIFISIAISISARAGPEPLVEIVTEKSASEKKLPEPTWNGDLGVNFVTAYIAFGILQENQGAIAEPYLDIYHTLFESDGWITKLSLGLQLWSSIHSEETLAKPDSTFAAWYEFDYYVPLAITIGKRTTVTISYLEYDFPNGAFTPQRGVQANIAYDDSDLLGAFALHPHILALYNFDGILGVGKSHAWYGEIGVAPGFVLAKKGTYPITFSFPVILGVGDAHFYPTDAYGYFSAAANTSIPLAFLPKSFGAWTANVGFTYYNLGNATTAINNGDRNAYVGQVGIGSTF